MGKTQAALAAAFRGQAYWRREKAKEYPDDRRNDWAARSIDALADYVLTLPDNDLRIAQIGALTMIEGDDDIAHLGIEASHAVGRFGFEGLVIHAEELDVFLDVLLDDVEADALESARMGGLFDKE